MSAAGSALLACRPEQGLPSLYRLRASSWYELITRRCRRRSRRSVKGMIHERILTRALGWQWAVVRWRSGPRLRCPRWGS
ncbi:hypothetical protein IG631_23099 [Alternaria alternata]|nr:hypothetical protein IG631_23099 [Alternaria alternata]